MKRFFRFFIIFSAVIFFGVTLCVAQEEGLSPVLETRFFTVYAPANMDLDSLLTTLNVNYFLRPELLAELGNSDKSQLAQTLDAIFLETSDILDIHIYSFRGNIKILSDRKALNSVFRNYFARDYPERSFYLHEKNTIYISFADITLGMLGHEIAHAIISHYFVVPPSAKVQEILSGYVEYNLRKSTDTLSSQQ